MPPVAHTLFKVSDIGPNDYVIVLCDKVDGDECYFPVPGTQDYVWVARVKKVTRVGGDTFQLIGWFLWNEDRDLTHPLLERTKTDPIDLEEGAIVGVFEYEEDFRLTHANVKAIVKNVRKLD